MTVLDPFAQLIFRLLVARVVERADRFLSPSVLHARVGTTATGWYTKPWQMAQATKREFIRHHVASDEFHGYGLADMRSHYETVHVATLRRLLHAAGNFPSAVDDLINFLDGLHEIPGVASGLPIGPEASAPLGTLALRPLDQRLNNVGATFIRYMDDVTIFTASEAEFLSRVDVLDEQAQIGSQTLNMAKLDYIECRSAGGGGSATASMEGDEFDGDTCDALESLADAIADGDDSRIPFLLGGLRARHDPRAISLLERARWVVRRLPRQSARYLRAVIDGIHDWEWIREEVFQGAQQSEPATALHFAPLIPSRELPSSFGSELWELANSLNVQTRSPLRAMLFLTTGRSQEKSKVRVHRALDAADSLGDLNERRALLGSLRSCGGLSGHGRAGVTHMARVEPDLEPTAAWVRN